MHVQTGQESKARLQSMPMQSVTLREGMWRQRQRTNRAVTIPHGYRKLHEAGNLNNLLLAAGRGEGDYRAPVFMDSDVYKWLEAASYALADGPDPELEGWVDEVIAIVADAQMADGYLDSYYQVNYPDKRWTNIDHDHELYCAGHLFEAAVAHHRATGKRGLLDVACRLADHIDGVFGPGKRGEAPGHPEIELALVEMYRETGERRYLALAQFFVDRRGQGTMRGHDRMGPAYHQDAVSVRQADEVVGHAVRQLYLCAGAMDVYLETGEPALGDGQQRLWHNAVTRKQHVIGGYGARHAGEAFGADYELPNETCYLETCAAIAAMMWNWRLLLASGDVRYAEELERSMYNGFLSGVSLDGAHFFYVNPLWSPGGIARPEWYGCACCPPNVMRQIAMIEHYALTQDASGVQLQQYLPLDAQTAHARVTIDCDYPRDGRIELTLDACAGGEWTLSLRVPSFCAGATVRVNDGAPLPAAAGAMIDLTRSWRDGDAVVLNLPLAPRWIEGNPRVDATRGALALAYGPLVYCLESVDQAPGTDLRDVYVDPEQPVQVEHCPDLLGDIVRLRVGGGLLSSSELQDWLYRPWGGPALSRRPVELLAVPYYAWANRGDGAMRVWLPRG